MWSSHYRYFVFVLVYLVYNFVWFSKWSDLCEHWNFDHIQWMSFISCCQDNSIGETQKKLRDFLLHTLVVQECQNHTISFASHRWVCLSVSTQTTNYLIDFVSASNSTVCKQLCTSLLNVKLSRISKISRIFWCAGWSIQQPMKMYRPKHWKMLN